MKPGKAPEGLKDVWHVGYYISTSTGYDVRWAAFVAFSDGSITKYPSSVFTEGIDASKRNHPKSWGEWQEKNQSLQVKWGKNEAFTEYEVSKKARSGSGDERLSTCFTSLTFSSISDSNTAAQSKEWCFARNGRFSNDSSVSINVDEGSGNIYSDKTGWYRIDGHVIQLAYDNGEQLTTTFGLVEDWDEGSTLLLLGGNRYED